MTEAHLKGARKKIAFLAGHSANPPYWLAEIGNLCKFLFIIVLYINIYVFETSKFRHEKWHEKKLKISPENKKSCTAETRKLEK